MPLLEFTRQVVELTMQEHGKNRVKTVRSRTCSRTVQATVRFDNGRHLIYVAPLANYLWSLPELQEEGPVQVRQV